MKNTCWCLWLAPARIIAFFDFKTSSLELAEKLEQLRALEAGMRIAVAEIYNAPGGVDTAEDLQAPDSALPPRNAARLAMTKLANQTDQCK